MKKNWKFATMALVASMTLFTTACSDDTPNENGGDGNGNEDSAYTLDKNIESDLTLEEGKTYTFHLRKDAKWSDGSLVTAKDFEYSRRRIGWM